MIGFAHARGQLHPQQLPEVGQQLRPHRVGRMPGTTMLLLDTASAAGKLLRLRVWHWRFVSCVNGM